jgi:hypothetical protein
MAGDAQEQRLDALGLFISGICLVHCLALPIAALVIPAFSLGFDEETDHAFHWWLLAFAVPISSLALWRGAVRTGNRRWLKLGSAGLLLMLLGVLHVAGPDSEVPLTMLGVVLLSIAHLRNFASLTRHRHTAD